jgi:hypothetical protein
MVVEILSGGEFQVLQHSNGPGEGKSIHSLDELFVINKAHSLPAKIRVSKEV